jgi:hypothetical protein
VKTQVNRDLTYRVEIARDEGEDWGYSDRGVTYAVDTVEVSVRVNEKGSFRIAMMPRIVKGYRIRKDGSQGARMGYYSYYPSVKERDEQFKEEALRVARAEYLAAR